MLTNVYSLLPNLFNNSEIEVVYQNVNYIKYKNDYQYPRIYELTKKNMKDNEITTLNE